ncbi:NADPH-dependent 1-acyldihydroxyacetone phosphate reductase [Colletotrichum tanaceti]|uniref:NADPH-dependent 1-acyldihydroxyacetone phosphate reductase n=1 Tax=Colletotrichum tanaceti TaxID=1306861 RepID=A0A4U6XFN7_9PEZI|nr:NADPH-dependent 1-acyldihydroxyacetone phosphate reductase [Colletotrichum tanaceti]TKW54678.1 NADPH-dependent 1-acyldihydroxyacetone phosphate reductase [Colletotrichum tanaceti]
MAQKTILITRCSDSGLSSALALAFSKASWRVFATAHNPSKLEQTTAAGIEALPLDVLSKSSISEYVSRIGQLTGRSLDVLLNNASASYSMPLMDTSPEQTRKLAPFRIKVINLKTGTVTSNFIQNLPPAMLPAKSLYRIAREEVKRVMSAKKIQKEGTSAEA